jgi:hypothetical protein
MRTHVHEPVGAAHALSIGREQPEAAHEVDLHQTALSEQGPQSQRLLCCSLGLYVMVVQEGCCKDSM